MMAKIGIVLLGIFLAGVFLNVYGVALVMITGLLLGIKNEEWVTAEYWTCLVAGAVTSLMLTRQIWPQEKSRS